MTKQLAELQTWIEEAREIEGQPSTWSDPKRWPHSPPMRTRSSPGQVSSHT